MKITKSELKEMIREVVKEELNTKKLTESKLTWNKLLEAADDLLAKLIVESDNADYDDGDGYWSGAEGHEWTNRYLYNSDSLNNIAALQKLCNDYSNKLPNVEFYFSEDDDISEIGYTAINADHE